MQQATEVSRCCVDSAVHTESAAAALEANEAASQQRQDGADQSQIAAEATIF